GVSAWVVRVAPRTSTPPDKRDRTASTWDGVRSSHSSVSRNAVSTAFRGPGDGAKQLDGSSALTHTKVLLQRCSALKASATSWRRVRQSGWRSVSVWTSERLAISKAVNGASTTDELLRRYRKLTVVSRALSGRL